MIQSCKSDFSLRRFVVSDFYLDPEEEQEEEAEPENGDDSDDGGDGESDGGYPYNLPYPDD